jgi:hypothetical protein
LRAVASQWASLDANSAAAWLKTLPEDKARVDAISAFVDNTSYQNPALAAQWVEKLPNDQGRNYRLENVARRWLEADEQAAITWINKSPLTEQQKERLLKNRNQ